MLASGLTTLYTIFLSMWMQLSQQMTRRIADHIARTWARRILNIVETKLEIRGQMPILKPNHCYMIMSNHNSLYDIPLIFASCPGSIRMLAKKELYQIPLFGWLLKYNEFVKIDRKNHEQAIKDLQNAETAMRSGIILWASPEGTRSKTDELLPFKKGIFTVALDTKATIIPVGIHGAHTLLPAKTWHFRPGTKIVVTIGEPIEIPVGTAPAPTKEQLRDQVRHSIAHLIQTGKKDESKSPPK